MQCNVLILQGMLAKGSVRVQGRSSSRKRSQLACKVAWNEKRLLVVDDKPIGVAPLGDVVMVPPVLAIVCHDHLLTVLIIANCAQLTVLQWAGDPLY